MIAAKLVAVVIIGYLLGSIPFGLIISKFKSDIDIREYGSGKTGATNVMRVAGTKLGVLTMVLDVCKAAGAVLIAKVIMDGGILIIGSVSIHWQHIAQMVYILTGVAGHNWPIFAKFKGGRGATAYFGTVLAIFPPAGIFGAEILAISALRSRYMSLGSILGAIATWCLMIPLTIAYGLPPIFLAYGLAAMALIIYQHRDNISRLQRGTERRLGQKDF